MSDVDENIPLWREGSLQWEQEGCCNSVQLWTKDGRDSMHGRVFPFPVGLDRTISTRKTSPRHGTGEADGGAQNIFFVAFLDAINETSFQGVGREKALGFEKREGGKRSLDKRKHEQQGNVVLQAHWVCGHTLKFFNLNVTVQLNLFSKQK